MILIQHENSAKKLSAHISVSFTSTFISHMMPEARLSHSKNKIEKILMFCVSGCRNLNTQQQQRVW